MLRRCPSVAPSCSWYFTAIGSSAFEGRYLTIDHLASQLFLISQVQRPPLLLAPLVKMSKKGYTKMHCLMNWLNLKLKQ